MQSSKWVEVRKEKKREKTHQTGVGVWGGAASECGWTSDLRRSVGWSNFDLLSVRGMEATSTEYEFWGERECRERISSLKKWKQQQQPFLVLAQMK